MSDKGFNYIKRTLRRLLLLLFASPALHEGSSQGYLDALEDDIDVALGSLEPAIRQIVREEVAKALKAEEG